MHAVPAALPRRRASSEAGRRDAPCAPAARASWWILALVLVLFGVSFALFYPQVAINVDEASYIRQARLILETADGRLELPKTHAITGEPIRVIAARYPVGTAFSLAPAIELFGTRGAFVVPFLSVLIGVLLTARWLAREGRSPLFALLILGFPATLVLSRVAMSDAPSLAVVSFGLWLFWRGLDGGRGWWLAAGFVAGASILWRESNALLFAGFFAGAVLRRERRSWLLVAGGLAGVSLRLLASHHFYGDPFFYRSTSANFGRDGVAQTLLLQIAGLVILVPGGLAFAFAYRGRRWPELLATVAGFTGFYLVYGYAASESAFAKRLVLGLRFYLPLLPVLAFAAGESGPRLWRGLHAALPLPSQPRLRTLTAGAVAFWITAVTGASVGVHWWQHRWTHDQARMSRAIREHVGTRDAIVTNAYATSKFIDWTDQDILRVNRTELLPTEARWLTRRHGQFFLVLLDRSDSAFWRDDARANAAFVAELRPRPTLLFDQQFSATDRLRIWRVSDRAPTLAHQAQASDESRTALARLGGVSGY